MEYQILQATFNSNYTIEVKFRDGLSGIVQILNSRLRGVFKVLNDVNLFKSGYLDHGAVTWSVGNDDVLDLAPDTMYEEIKKNNGIYVMK